MAVRRHFPKWALKVHYLEVTLLAAPFWLSVMSLSTISTMPSLDAHQCKASLFVAVIEWIPLVGILVLHLALGLCVDTWKGGANALDIEELLAR